MQGGFSKEEPACATLTATVTAMVMTSKPGGRFSKGPQIRRGISSNLIQCLDGMLLGSYNDGDIRPVYGDFRSPVYSEIAGQCMSHPN